MGAGLIAGPSSDDDDGYRRLIAGGYRRPVAGPFRIANHPPIMYIVNSHARFEVSSEESRKECCG